MQRRGGPCTFEHWMEALTTLFEEEEEEAAYFEEEEEVEATRKPIEDF